MFERHLHHLFLNLRNLGCWSLSGLSISVLTFWGGIVFAMLIFKNVVGFINLYSF